MSDRNLTINALVSGVSACIRAICRKSQYLKVMWDAFLAVTHAPSRSTDARTDNE